jgi:microcystin-dependent protein
VAFTTAFASQTPSGSVSVSGSAGNTTLTTPQIPSHRHPVNVQQPAPIANRNIPATMNVQAAISGPYSIQGGTHPGFPPGNAMNTTGGDGSHNHPLTISSATFSGSAINLAVSYVDVIRATKD